MMNNIEIALSTPQNLGVTVDKIIVRRVNLKPDLSGEWQIGVDLNTSSPTRVEVEGLSPMERYLVGAQIIVTPEEIAAHAEIELSEVKNLPLSQIQEHVTAIGLSKVLTSFGLTA
jgi:hypothetical protein